MLDTETGKEGVDRSKLDSRSSALIPNLSRFDMRATIRSQQGNRAEAIQDSLAITWTSEALKQFLQHQSGGEDSFPAEQRLLESADLVRRFLSITPQSKRPNTGVHEEAHCRERSAL